MTVLDPVLARCSLDDAASTMRGRLILDVLESDDALPPASLGGVDACERA